MSLFDLGLAYLLLCLICAVPSASLGIAVTLIPYVLGYAICKCLYKEYVGKKEAREEAEELAKIRKRDEEFDLYYKAEKKRRKKAGCSLKSAEDEDMAIYSSWPIK